MKPPRRSSRLSLVGTIVLLAPVAAVSLSSSAAVADSCDHSVHGTHGKGRIDALAVVVGDAVYNATSGSVKQTVTVGSSHSWGETKTTTFGGEAGLSWSVIHATVSRTWGTAAVTGASVSASTSIEIPIPSHWTGWVTVNPYRHYYWFKGTTERWDANTLRCVTHLVYSQSWGDAQRLLVAHTHKGRYYPGVSD